VQFISWLIVSHHRLPVYEPSCYRGSAQRAKEQTRGRWEYGHDEFYEDLSPGLELTAGQAA